MFDLRRLMNENIRLDDSTVFNPQTGEFGTLPEIFQFSADRYILVDETPATVSWTVSNATIIRLNDEIVEPTGTREFYTNDILTLTLSAANDLGDAAPQTISIDIDRHPPIIGSFDVNPSFSFIGSPVVLSWDVEGARYVEIDNGIGDVSNTNTKTVTLDPNGVFKLTAQNYFGIKSEATAAVSIFPVPLIEGIFIPRPRFNFQRISFGQPVFNLQTELSNEIEINLPVFTELDKLGSRILLSKKLSSVLFANNIFKILIDKQKEIAYIVKFIWKKRIRKLMKANMERN